MNSVFRPFPLPLTGRQWFYITFLQGVGAGVIDGGANFGIAYAMYHGQDVVKMWVFSKNTIAGDLGVTPIIQCLASMLITSTLVHSDLHHSAVKPLPYVYPHVEHLPDPRELLSRSYRRQQRDPTALRPTTSDETAVGHDNEAEKGKVGSPPGRKGLSYYYWMLVRFIFEGTERNMLLARPGFANWSGRFIWTAAQGAGIGIICGFPIWCLAIVILGPIYGNDNMGNKWAPQVIKLVYGAIVGWITNPIIAILALGSQADHHLVVVKQDEEEAVQAEGGQQVETIQEEDDEGDQAERLAPPASPRRVPPSPRASAPPSPLTRTLPLVAPRRRRASSSTSTLPSRPPLTANVSQLSPLPPSYLTLAPAIDTPTRPTYGRERGTTVSSVGSGISYALGGTGGRAKRPRAGTSASLGNAPVTPAVTMSDTTNADPGRPRAGSWDVFGRRVTAPTGVPTVTTGTRGSAGRTRSASTLAALRESRESRQVERP